jgi:ATP-dependent Clp protease ATP-binding subunit ClpA
LVFERFTERARQVVVLAQEEARALRHNYIGTEHILLGLLREEEGLAARVLTDLGLTVEDVRKEVVRLVGPGEEVASGQIPFTVRAKKVLEAALREALFLGNNHIETEHILLGLVSGDEGVAARILLHAGMDPDRIRDRVTQLLSGPSGRRPPTGGEPGAGAGAAADVPGRRVRRFTSQARQAVEAARREAFSLGHAHIGSEHILLGLLSDAESESAQIVAAFGVSVQGVRSHVERLGRSTQAATAEEIPFAPQAHQALDRAQVHAANFGHGQVDTTHLLLSLTEENSVAARILSEEGAEPRKIRRQVLHALGNSARLIAPERASHRISATLGWRLDDLPGKFFERFTEQAKQTVFLAQDEARALHHLHVGTEHILLGLLNQSDGAAAAALANLHVTPDGVRELIAKHVGKGTEAPASDVAFTPQAVAALDGALHEALPLGKNYVATEHILLSVIRDNEGRAVANLLLRELGADRLTVRQELTRVGVEGLRSEPVVKPPDPDNDPRYVRLAPATRGLDWRRATLLWRPEGLELRVPLRLSVAQMATFAADEVWSREPLVGLRREIWTGWLALASPTLMGDIGDPQELRRVLDAAAKRAVDADADGGDGAATADFLDRLRADP